MKKEKKILKIVDKMTSNDNKNRKILMSERKFLTNYAIDNHLLDVVCSYKGDDRKLKWFIESFVRIYDEDTYINSKNCCSYKEGEDTFLHIAIKNEVDMDYIEYILEYIYDYIFFDFESVNDFYKHKGKNNKTIFHSLCESDRHFLEYETRQLLNIIAEESIDIIIDLYDEIYDAYNNGSGCSVVQIIRDIIFDNKDEFAEYLCANKDKAKEIIEKLFYDIDYNDKESNLLWLCRYDYQYVHLEELKLLLELGVDPNFVNEENDDFIMSFINNSFHDVEDIISLLKIALKYGYKINKEKNILDAWLSGDVDINSKYVIYKFMSGNGFNTFTANIDKDALFDIDESLDFYLPNSVYDTQKQLIKLYDCNYITDGLNYMLKNNNLTLTTSFNNDLSKIHSEFIGFKKIAMEFSGIRNEGHFIRMLSDEVVNICCNSVNGIAYDDKVSLNVVLDALKQTIIKNQHRLFDSIDKCKIKQIKRVNNKQND